MSCRTALGPKRKHGPSGSGRYSSGRDAQGHANRRYPTAGSEACCWRADAGWTRTESCSRHPASLGLAPGLGLDFNTRCVRLRPGRKAIASGRHGGRSNARCAFDCLLSCQCGSGGFARQYRRCALRKVNLERHKSRPCAEVHGSASDQLRQSSRGSGAITGWALRASDRMTGAWHRSGAHSANPFGGTQSSAAPLTSPAFTAPQRAARRSCRTPS